jgi:uncharacterized HAD superfamily protein
MSDRIYVDIDDVLSRTIERLIDLLEEMHARRVEVEEVRHFDLEKSFSLDGAEIQAFMDRAHSDAEIEAIAPAAGAAEVLAGWAESGHSISLVTGRPPITNEASRRWLERHSIAHHALHHLDKWGRPTWNEDGLPAIGFDDLPAFGFGFAVEDSLDTAVRLVEVLDVPVALMDRPWNRDVGGLSAGLRERLVRCHDWQQVSRFFDERR